MKSRNYLLAVVLLMGTLVHQSAEAEQSVVSQVFSREGALNARDFTDLQTTGAQTWSGIGATCKKQEKSKKTNLPDVFGDSNFEKRFADDPVFQKISFILYFNEAASVVPDELLPQFKQYAKAFYVLYQAGSVRSPDVSHLDLDHAGDLSSFALEGQPIIFETPKSKEERQAYDIVQAGNLKFKYTADALGPDSFSAAMIEIMADISRFQGICKMDTAEITALGIYIGMGFRKINPYLREHKSDDPRMNLLEVLINHALDKLANSESLVFRTTTFYHQADMPEAVYHQHTMGSKIVYDAFTSTTSAGISSANFLIYSRTGKALGPLSIESEILFKSHTSFKVRYNSCEDEHLKVWQGCKVILEEAQ